MAPPGYRQCTLCGITTQTATDIKQAVESEGHQMVWDRRYIGAFACNTCVDRYGVEAELESGDFYMVGIKGPKVIEDPEMVSLLSVMVS